MSRLSTGLPDVAFWQGRRVLLTGHTGFKGSWLTCWLRHLGAEVMGVSLPNPPTVPSLWDQLALPEVRELRADIATIAWLSEARSFEPDIVLHLAAQSLVSVGYDQPARTFETNVLGTVRVLQLLATLDNLRAALVITTDKVYAPSQPLPHDESHSFGGREPYSASKAAAEIVVAGWPPLPAPVATARAGNVIGGGDWATDRLLPDLVRAWTAGNTPSLRGPHSVRPWQHVLEPLRGYLLYAEALAVGHAVAAGMNFGPHDDQSVRVGELVRFAAADWQRLGGQVPNPAWSESANTPFAETTELTLNSALADKQLGWASVLGWQEAVSMTLDWYYRARAGDDPTTLITEQLTTYTSMIRCQP